VFEGEGVKARKEEGESDVQDKKPNKAKERSQPAT